MQIFHFNSHRHRTNFAFLLIFQAILIVATMDVTLAMGSETANDTCGSTMAPTSLSPKSQKLLNSAFLFVKPHANTEKVRNLVMKKLESEGITILSEKDIGGEEIDRKGLIDQHYYSIASKATILSAENIAVPKEKFRETFGEKWETVLKEDRAVNALTACKRFQCTPQELNEAWRKAHAVKFGGGFYCAKMSVNDNPELYVFNAFFMTMRSKFVGKENKIHCFEVEWDPKDLSWSSFRNDVLGPTDPSTAPQNSIRRLALDQYKELGLSSKPNNSDNSVHASASPFEALAEKMNWLGLDIATDDLGRALLNAGLSKSRILEWSRDPQIKLSLSSTGSIFDELEDLDVDDCVKKLIELNSLN